MSTYPSLYNSPFAFRTNDGKRSTNLSRQRRVQLAWKWKAWIRRRKLPRWHVWKTASFLSTVDHLLSIPTSGAGENFEMYSIPPASLGRVEFFNSHNSVARWLSPSLFSSLSSLHEPFDAADTLLAWWKLRARRKHCIITWKPRRWHCLVILWRFGYESSDKQRKHYHENNLALIKRLEAAENKIVRFK